MDRGEKGAPNLTGKDLTLKQIVIVALNPAWQKVLKFARLDIGGVNRAASVSYSAAGKGVNFARAVNVWGNGVSARVFQFAGGKTGRQLCNAMDAEGIRHRTVQVQAETRVCTSCISEDNRTITELIEPSESVPHSAGKEIYNLVVSELGAKTCLALCGTFPSGVGTDFYARIAAEAGRRDIPVFVDAHQNVEGALQSGIDMLKINDFEIGIVSGRKNLSSAALHCMRKYRLRRLAVTAGPKKALLFTRDEGEFEYTVPEIENVVNPIGAGDTAGAVTLAELCAGENVAEAFANGLAAACASCITELPAMFDKRDALRFREKIKMKKL